MRRRTIVALSAAVLGAVLLAPLAGNREERQLRRRVKELCALTRLKNKESPLAAAARSRQIGGFFASDVRLGEEVIPFPASSRQDLVAAVFHARTQLDRFEATVHDIAVEIAPGRQAARMTVAARAEATAGGETERAWHEFEVDWVRGADGWLISAVAVIEPIRRPGGA